VIAGIAIELLGRQVRHGGSQGCSLLPAPAVVLRQAGVELFTQTKPDVLARLVQQSENGSAARAAADVVRSSRLGGLDVSARTAPRFTRDADLAVAVASDAEPDPQSPAA
jgi:hypothetical protein